MRRLCAGAVILLLVGLVAPVAVGGVAAADVTLTLTATEDGSPVGDVTLRVTWSNGSEEVTTLSNGKEFVDVPAGERVEIAVADDTYIRNSPVVVGNASGQDVEVPISLPGTVDVTVADSTGPVPDASVQLFDNGADEGARTDDAGQVTLGPVERDRYRLRVSKSGYLRNTTGVSITGNVSKTVQIRRDAVELSVNVTDDHFDPAQPVEGVRVQVGEEATLTTLPTGRQGTTVPVNRDYEVTVSKDGYVSASRSVSVDERPEQVSFIINREPAIGVDAANDRVVVGESTRLTVTDEYDEPVAGATVSVGGSEVGTTGEDGTYDVEIPEAGNTTVEVRAEGLSDSVTVEGVDPGGEATPTATPTATETTTTATQTETEGGGSPGFGALAAVLALLALVALARER
jgi:PGF-CTERM protein